MFNQIFDDFAGEIKRGEHDFLKFDQIKLDEVSKLAKELNDQYDYVAIVGFGASSLNTRAICSSISKPLKKTIYLDSIDELDIEEKLKSIDVQKTIFFVLSKSGNTSETYLLTKYILETKKVSNKNIYIISPKGNNLLSNLAKAYKTMYIEHEAQRSGRFGIISATTLLPCSLIGLDIEKFVSSSLISLSNIILNSQNVINAAKYYLENYSLGRRILVALNYCHQLDGFCRWQQQLIGESLGKNNFGITPVLSKGTFDEHSQLQLYLEGPDDKFYKIMVLDQKDTMLSTSLVLHAYNTSKALINIGRPISIESFTSINEEIVAKLIIESMFIVVMVARYQKLNPFDQPSVDVCKIDQKASK